MYYQIHSTKNPLKAVDFTDLDGAVAHLRNILGELEAEGNVAQAAPYASGHPMLGWVQIRIMLTEEG